MNHVNGDSNSWFDDLSPLEIRTLYILLDMFKSLAQCRHVIGRTAAEQHPDELNPRAETWMKERKNWETEVATLRKRVAELEAND